MTNQRAFWDPWLLVPVTRIWTFFIPPSPVRTYDILWGYACGWINFNTNEFWLQACSKFFPANKASKFRTVGILWLDGILCWDYFTGWDTGFWDWTTGSCFWTGFCSTGLETGSTCFIGCWTDCWTGCWTGWDTFLGSYFFGASWVLAGCVFGCYWITDFFSSTFGAVC